MKKNNTFFNLTIKRLIRHFLTINSFLDVWFITIHIITIVFGKILKIKHLIIYDILLSGKYAIAKLKEFDEGDKYNFNGILLPKIELKEPNDFKKLYELYMYAIETLYIYLYNNDDYSSKIVDLYDKYVPDGSYFYKNNNGIDVTIKNGDIVLDLGACLGEFSVYAAKRGATVYAFEPSKTNRELLIETIKLNGLEKNINIIPFGVGEKNETLYFNNKTGNIGASTFINEADPSTEAVEVVCLDDWAKNMKLSISFIKADIEGFERYMLLGAKYLLQTQHPKLSLCTYHLVDDPLVIKNTIINANPQYEIIQRHFKLFACIPGF